MIRLLISLAASALRCARLRTSPATTAKPRSCSPARAASTAAFSARMLVWNAMPSITPMMSAIWRDASLMPFIVCTTCPTTSPPLTATLDAPRASSLACCAWPAFCCTVEPNCSIDDAVLFVDRQAVGVIEAKKDDTILTFNEDQTLRYSLSALKWQVGAGPLPFLYESTGKITRFYDLRTNMHFTLKTKPLKSGDLEDF